MQTKFLLKQHRKVSVESVRSIRESGNLFQEGNSSSYSLMTFLLHVNSAKQTLSLVSAIKHIWFIHNIWHYINVFWLTD